MSEVNKDTAANAAASAVERAEALLAQQSEEEVFASVPQPRRLPMPKLKEPGAEEELAPVAASASDEPNEASPAAAAAVEPEAAEPEAVAEETTTAAPMTLSGIEIDEARGKELREGVIEALREIFDPEIPVNIYDLGLIYSVEVDERARVAIQMTLTSPNCPVAGTLPGEVEVKAASVDGVDAAWVDLVWEPTWGPDSMSEEAKLQLGFF